MNDAQFLRQGVAAVVLCEEKFLVIERSRHVVAPGALCFPGGAVEPGEVEANAIAREMHEELGAIAAAHRLLWRSTTEWRVAIAWWQTRLAHDRPLTPNPLEVASVYWLTAEELAAQPNLLSSNREFLRALAKGDFTLDER